MGAKKDINRVRELIVGKDIQRIEERFNALEEMILSMETQHQLFERKIKKSLVQVEKQIDDEKRHTSIQFKTLKTEIKMYMKSKLNSIEKSKLSHHDLSSLFSSLSKELEEVDNIAHNARK